MIESLAVFKEDTMMCERIEYSFGSPETNGYLLHNDKFDAKFVDEQLFNDLFIFDTNGFAIPLDETYDMVRFDGFDTPYPEWFGNMLDNGLVIYTNYIYIYAGPSGDELVDLGDVFLYNRVTQDAYFMPVWRFEELCYEVD